VLENVEFGHGHVRTDYRRATSRNRARCTCSSPRVYLTPGWQWSSRRLVTRTCEMRVDPIGRSGDKRSLSPCARYSTCAFYLRIT